MNRFIARQPIFDRHMVVVSYELLFRTDLDNYCKSFDLEQMSSAVISDSMAVFDIEQLTNGRGAFMNFDRTALLNGYAALLPPGLVTIELLESVEADPETVTACRAIKKAGYKIALDDFVDRPEVEPLIALADCLKIDVLATKREELTSLVARRRRPGLRLLAEKVESREVYEYTSSLGFSLFQGFFFEKPTIVSKKDVPGFKLNYLRLLKETHAGDISLDRVEEITRQDVSILYKLFRDINSAGFGLRNRVSSIREALFLLGEDNIRKLVTLWALTGLGQNEPAELIVQSVVRAHLCESVARQTLGAAAKAEAFLIGVFSLIDVIVGQPMADVVSQLPVSEAVQQGLIDQSGKLRPILDCVIAYERGNWESFSQLAGQLGVEEALFPELHRAAVAGAGELVGKETGPTPHPVRTKK